MGNIVLRNVNKSFGATTIIPNIDLDIADGEFVVFVGPSGCGKSTLLRLIAGLEDMTSGKISIDGRDVTEEAPAERKLAMVFQSYALYPHMTVRNNIAFPLKMAGEAKAVIDKKVNDAARILNLDQLPRPPAETALRRPAPARGDRPRHRPPARTPSCSTSRCPISTRHCAARCGWRSASCTSSSRRPWSTSPTIRSRR